MFAILHPGPVDAMVASGAAMRSGAAGKEPALVWACRSSRTSGAAHSPRRSIMLPRGEHQLGGMHNAIIGRDNLGDRACAILGVLAG